MWLRRGAEIRIGPEEIRNATRAETPSLRCRSSAVQRFKGSAVPPQFAAQHIGTAWCGRHAKCAIDA
ncbi:hypothetical protein C7S16_3848 [Burkholderia thailandensis]|uniref:Uncharacterized protein n=1 Tax=Burkholderia thailandensis TaxID=57975 RepID=A0AAW9D0Q1_BURTH|nr:hypothetical protein [Burkholderia thailandensis]MDW9256387.1 hypothetical protein [Burkholderia thailandensis]